MGPSDHPPSSNVVKLSIPIDSNACKLLLSFWSNWWHNAGGETPSTGKSVLGVQECQTRSTVFEKCTYVLSIETTVLKTITNMQRTTHTTRIQDFTTFWAKIRDKVGINHMAGKDV